MPRPASPAFGSSEHAVHFYEEGASLIDAACAFLGEGLEAGEPAVVVATDQHRRAIRAGNRPAPRAGGRV